MIKVGITGEMGSGKSFCAELFVSLGVPIFNSDKIIKNLQNSNENLRLDIINAFGNIYVNNKLDVLLTRKLVFSDSDESRSNLKRLTEICSPYVQSSFMEFCESHSDCQYVIGESAILFETGFNRFFDKIIYVTANYELRLKRAIERDGISEYEYKQRMKDQMHPDLKKKGSHFIVDNDYTNSLIPKIESLHKRLLQLC